MNINQDLHPLLQSSDSHTHELTSRQYFINSFMFIFTYCYHQLLHLSASNVQPNVLIKHMQQKDITIMILQKAQKKKKHKAQGVIDLVI